MPFKTGQALQGIVKKFLRECKEKKYDMEPGLAQRIVHLLAKDIRYGLLCVEITQCRKHQFYIKLMETFLEPFSPTINVIKLCYYFGSYKDMYINIFKEKYEEDFKNKLQVLIDRILQYPENSSFPKQIEDMELKMHYFIISWYHLGDPRNHVLLKIVRQSMDSIVGKVDLRDYVLKKKYHRLEYLERLAGTVAGIVIYNNCDETGEKENIINLFADLDMAVENTRICLDSEKKATALHISYGQKFIEGILHIDIIKQKIYSKLAIDRIRYINNFYILFLVYEKKLKQLQECFERTEYLIRCGKKKMECIYEKLDNAHKKRELVDSQAIFPHFFYLGQVWNELSLYLEHLGKINEIKDKMDKCYNIEMREYYVEKIDEAKLKTKTLPSIDYTFEELKKRNTKVVVNANLLKLENCSKDYCTFTLGFTSGILLKSSIEKKLCENLKLKFGFLNYDVAKYSERHIEEFMLLYKNAVYTSVNLISLFNLEEEVLRKPPKDVNCDLVKLAKFPLSNKRLQTEMVVQNDLSEKNWLNCTWNKWDFHRETIRLANMRKCQTRAAQTNNTFGKRNASQQYYNHRSHHDFCG